MKEREPISTPTDKTTGKGKIKVLFLNTRSALGADVAVHLSLIRNLDPARVEVFVATNRHSRDLDKTLNQLSCVHPDRLKVIDLGHEISTAGGGTLGKAKRALKNLPALLSILKLAHWIKKNGIQIIHSTDRPRDAIFTSLLSKWSGTRHVLHAHINWYPYLGKGIESALKSCSGIIAVSNFTRDSFVEGGVASSKICIAHNATDTAKFDPDRTQYGIFRREQNIPAGAPLIGIVARIMIWKGHLELIEAFARVKRCIPEARLAIIGEEDLLAAEAGKSFGAIIREKISELGLTDSVHWTGWQDKMPEVMQDLDILAMPSHAEPFGLAVTEAMAMQTPVVGFASGGLPEIIEDGREGFLVPLKNTDLLAEAMIALLKNPAMRSEMGRLGRQRVINQFTPQIQALAVETNYRTILA